MTGPLQVTMVSLIVNGSHVRSLLFQASYIQAASIHILCFVGRQSSNDWRTDKEIFIAQVDRFD